MVKINIILINKLDSKKISEFPRPCRCQSFSWGLNTSPPDSWVKVCIISTSTKYLPNKVMNLTILIGLTSERKPRENLTIYFFESEPASSSIPLRWVAVWSVKVYDVKVEWKSDHTINRQLVEKEMATHSSVLAWRIPGTAEPGGLPSMGVTQSRTRLKWLSSSSINRQIA